VNAIERVLLATHIASGSMALLAGGVALVASKGRRVHRGAGRLFRRLMVVVLVSAVATLPFRGNAFLGSLAVFAAYLTFSGVRILRRRHGAAPTALDAMAAVVALVIGVTLSLLAVARPPVQGIATVVSVLGGVVMFATYDLISQRARFSVRWPHAWVYEHIWKMVAAYTAVVSAFSGGVLPLFEPPWRQLWPTLASTPLTLWFFIAYRRRMRRGITLPGRDEPNAPARTGVA